MSNTLPQWTRRVLLPCALLLAAGLPAAAVASDDTPERAQLVAVLRQLELADSLTRHAGSVAHPPGARYHFDYPRLREDIQRVRSGIQSYLAPQRAQPRDPLPISGDYLLQDGQPEPAP